MGRGLIDRGRTVTHTRKTGEGKEVGGARSLLMFVLCYEASVYVCVCCAQHQQQLNEVELQLKAIWLLTEG